MGSSRYNKSNKKSTIESLIQKKAHISRTDAKEIATEIHQIQSIRSSPYPSADEYEHYHSIDPTLTDQMKLMVKDEQTHQHKLDLEHLKKSFELKKRGQWFGFCIFTLIVGSGVAVAFYIEAWPGALISSIGVVGIITQYLKG